MFAGLIGMIDPPRSEARDAVARARAFPGLNGADLAKIVSLHERQAWRGGAYDLDAQAFREPFSPRVVFGQACDVVIQCIEASGRENTRLAQSAAAHLTPAFGSLDQLGAAGQYRTRRRA